MRVRLPGIVAGLTAFVLLAGLDTPLRHYGDFGARPAWAAATGGLMAILWLTEALPIHVTALLPLALFPALGVFGRGAAGDALAAALPYVDAYIFLFLGGMCIAAAMQQWDLHRRIALGVMRVIGTDARRLLLGVLAATAFISLWISNTATAVMMVPIALAVIAQVEARAGAGGKLRGFGGALMLAVAYGANVGGIGTKIGTAPNAQLSGVLAAGGRDVAFLEFSAVTLPFVLLFLPVVWFALWRGARADAPVGEVGAAAIADEVARLGPMKPAERVVGGVFLAAATLWIAGQPITALLVSRGVAARPAHVEAGVGLLAAAVLLAWPVGGRRALDLGALRKLPYDALILLGGSFALAEGIKGSGLSAWLGERATAVRDMAPLLQATVASMTSVALSSVASNTATTAVMLNVLEDSIAPAHVATVLFAATIAASCDFALPAGTPPNAIVFASGYLTIPRMAKTGAALDVAAALLAGVWCYFAVPRIL